MHALFAVVLTLVPTHVPVTSAASLASRSAAPVFEQADEAPASTTLPGMPRAVVVTRTSEGAVLTWQRPESSGATPLLGYVVIVGETPSYLGHDVTRMVVPATASRVAVAAMNGVGCSIASEAGGQQARRESRVDVATLPPR